MMKLEFNWYTELNKAIKTEPSEEIYLDLEERAHHWVTCACGELCKTIPRNLDGKPEDSYLFHTGVYFSKCILNKNWPKALILLNNIEIRTAELLKELKL